MRKLEFQAEVRGDLIIVTEPASMFYAIYIKPKGHPQLLLQRRTETDDHEILAGAWHAANTKAREMGWIA